MGVWVRVVVAVGVGVSVGSGVLVGVGVGVSVGTGVLVGVGVGVSVGTGVFVGVIDAVAVGVNVAVAVGVGVPLEPGTAMVRASCRLTAPYLVQESSRTGSTPAPFALAKRMSRTWDAVATSGRLQTRAAAPETWGLDIEVPLNQV